MTAITFFTSESSCCGASILSCVLSEQLFPQLEPQWYDMAYQAAVNGKEIIMENMRIEEMRRNYYVTVSQVIRPGYCAFTYQELDLTGGTNPSSPSGS